MYCTSLGKAIAAYLPAAEMDELVAGLTFERLTPRTLTQPSKLKRELAKINQLGFAIDEEEAVTGARCIAAPIFDINGKVAAAISVSGPITRITSEKMPALITAVKKAGGVISTRLGYSNL
jgi:IclR family KDG regulon transcriptional repressor